MRQEWVSLVEFQRSGVTEVALHGAIAWVHGDELIRSVGQVTTFGRSLMKPYQIKVFAQDLAATLSWEAKAIALSSHNAEAAQVAAAQSMLAGTDAALLQTPPSLPLPGSSDPNAIPQKWHHPCSGKHAAILSGCKIRGWSREDYLAAEHPYHHAYLQGLRKVLGASWTPAVTAIDGCGLPTHTMTLAEMAQLFASLAAHRSEDWIWAAMLKHPELVGGQGRLDTAIMRAGGGKVLAKEGADGLLGLAVLHSDYPRGLGVVIKTAHGWDPKAMRYIVSHVLSSVGIDLPAPAAPSGQTVVYPEFV